MMMYRYNAAVSVCRFAYAISNKKFVSKLQFITYFVYVRFLSGSSLPVTLFLHFFFFHIRRSDITMRSGGKQSRAQTNNTHTNTHN